MHFRQWKRREVVSLLGGAAVAWPLEARAQQATLPVVGFLGTSSPDADGLRAFHRGLKEAGYVEGDNVTVLQRWAEGRLDQLPEVAIDLVRRRVAVIASFGNAPALAAKAATTTIPIVFGVSQDPVSIGLVDSFARPGGNVTGFNYLSAELAAKRLELLLELMPGAKNLVVLVDPAVPPTQPTLRDVTAAASTMGLRIKTLNASNSSEINAAFATLARERPDLLFVGPGFLFIDRRVQLVHLATLHKLPTTYTQRQFPEIGGLMSYGANYVDVYRQIGIYTGRILKGVKPADLPVVQSSKFEFVLNAQTALMLQLNVPPPLLAAADEVIE
jgi:putative tryptophan/tyrosine transport system substrate-binding protein